MSTGETQRELMVRLREEQSESAVDGCGVAGGEIMGDPPQSGATGDMGSVHKFAKLKMWLVFNFRAPVSF